MSRDRPGSSSAFFTRSSYPDVSAASASPSGSPTKSRRLPLRSASVMPLQSFVESRTSSARRSPWAQPLSSTPPPASNQQQQHQQRRDSSSPDFSDDAGIKNEHLRDSPVPPPSESTGHMFDSSLTDSEATMQPDQQRKKQLEAFKIPVPTLGGEARNSQPAAWRKQERDDSQESDIVALDDRPDVFRQQENGVKASQGAQDEELYDDDYDYEDETGGYDINSDNGYGYSGNDGYTDDNSYGDDNAVKQEQTPGLAAGIDQEFMGSNHQDYTETNDGEDEFMDDEEPKSEDEQQPGLWDESLTISSRGWNNSPPGQGGSAAPASYGPHPQSLSVWPKGKEVQPVQRPSFPQANSDFVSRNLHALSYQGGNRPAFGAQVKSNDNLSRPGSSTFGPLKDSAPIQDSFRRPFAGAKPPVRFGIDTPYVSQQAQPVPDKTRREDPDRTIRPTDGYQSNSGQQARPATPASPHGAVDNQSSAPYLSDDELKAIPNYSEVLKRLDSIYVSSRATAPANLEGDLKTLLAYAYPNKDIERPQKFFEALPDDSYEQAGDIILAMKRDLEDKLKKAGRKRRKVVAESVENVRGVADERVERLKLLEEKRQQLRGGVGRLLMENGFNALK